jgi:hypothetical protein
MGLRGFAPSSSLGRGGPRAILGQTMRDRSGQDHPGLGVLDVTTAPGRRRAVGEITTGCAIPGVGQLTGFENHQGITTLGAGTAPMGTVVTGTGTGTGNGTRDHTGRPRGRPHRPCHRHLPARPRSGPQPGPGRPHPDRDHRHRDGAPGAPRPGRAAPHLPRPPRDPQTPPPPPAHRETPFLATLTGTPPAVPVRRPPGWLSTGRPETAAAWAAPRGEGLSGRLRDRGGHVVGMRPSK